MAWESLLRLVHAHLYLGDAGGVLAEVPLGVGGAFGDDGDLFGALVERAFLGDVVDLRADDGEDFLHADEGCRGKTATRLAAVSALVMETVLVRPTSETSKNAPSKRAWFMRRRFFFSWSKVMPS